MLALLDWGAVSISRRTFLILFLGTLVILPGLAALPVTDRDEGRFVQASKQMMETGDLVDIRFQDQPRWKKPAGIYWLQAMSASALGGVEAPIWAYRIPSALAAFLVALMTAWAAGPLIGQRGAVLAGLMMVSTLLLAVEGNIAKTDAALAASATAALGAMAHLLLGTSRRWVALVFWLAIAASILLKGPIVPTIVILALAAFWIIRGRPKLGQFYPLMGLGLTVLLVAPWLIAIWQVSDGGFFSEALGKDLGGKLVEGQEKHWGPPGLYLGLVWATLWPWAAFLIPAVPWLWRQRREAWVCLLAGWVVPFWIVLEMVPTKLPHYVLPLYPALMIALAAWVLSMAEPGRWQRRVSAVLIAIPGLGLAAAPFVIPILLFGVALGTDQDRGESIMSFPGMALGLLGGFAVVLAALAAWRGRVMGQLGACLCAALVLFPAVLQFTLPAAKGAFPSIEMARLIAQYRPCASGPAFSIGYHEPSLVFLTETGIRMADPRGAIAALESDPGALVLIEDRWRGILGQALPDAVLRDRVEYFNYNRGKVQGAELITPDDPRWAACSAP
jgi:4-amino-4-deoxy-L-arabinose transferase-like glycosyltransferase